MVQAEAGEASASADFMPTPAQRRSAGDRGGVASTATNQGVGRVPNIAVPTRTSVALRPIAVSKLADMPMLRRLTPFRAAISASMAKWGSRSSLAGGIHISSVIASPYSLRHRAMNASVSSGTTPAAPLPAKLAFQWGDAICRREPRWIAMAARHLWHRKDRRGGGRCVMLNVMRMPPLRCARRGCGGNVCRDCRLC